MPIPVQLPNGEFIEFPDGTDFDTISRITEDYVKENRLLSPSFSESFGAGVDVLQSQLASLPLGVLDTLQTEVAGTQEEYDTLQEWKDIFARVREANRAEAAPIQGRMTPVTDIVEAPGTVVKEQVGFQLPQMLGLGAAAVVPGGQVVAPAAALTYFTASNIDRQLEEGLQPDLLKAAGFGSGQAGIETALLATLKGLPGGTLTQGLTKAAAVGIGGEVIQQGMERAAADLELLDDEAQKEYVDSAIGAGIFVGVGAPITYMALNNGNLISVSDTIKEKLDKQEPVRAEEIIEEQIRAAPGAVSLPDPIDPEATLTVNMDEVPISENIDSKNKSILAAAGLDPDYFTSPNDRYKAASVVIRNITDAETTEVKRNQLVEAGVDPQNVNVFKQANPKTFFEMPVQDVLAQIEGISVNEALKRLEPVLAEQGRIQADALNIANKPEIEVADENLTTLTQDISEFLANQEAADGFIRAIPKKIEQTPKEVEVPEWLRKPSASGVRRTLSIKPRAKVKQLVSQVADKGYLSFIKEVPDVDIEKAADLGKNIAADPAAPPKRVKKIAKALETVNNKKGLENTFNAFAQTEADLLNFKRNVNQRTQTPTDIVTPPSPQGLDAVAAAINIRPETVPFMDQVIRNATRSVAGLGRGVDVESVANKIGTDPVYKVQYANFIQTVLRPDDATPSDIIEQFFYVFDHTKVLSSVEKRRLERDFPVIYSKTASYFGLDAPNRNMIVGPEGQKELLANIYKEMMDGNGQKVLRGLSEPTKIALKKIKAFTEKARKEIRQQKVFEDSVLIGIDNDRNVNELRLQRMQALSAETEAQNHYKAILDSEDLVNEANFESDVKEVVGDGVFRNMAYQWVSNVASLQSLARQNKVAAQVLGVVDFRDIERSQNTAKLREFAFKLKEVENEAGPGFVEQVSERIHRLEEQEGSYDLTDPQSVVFKNKQGQPIRRIRGERVHRAFKIIDDFKQEKLNQEEASLRVRLKYLGVSKPEITTTDLSKLITLVEGNNNVIRATDKAQAKLVDQRVTQLKELTRRLELVDTLRTKAYFPRQRTGALGIVVKPKDSDRSAYFRQFDAETGVRATGPNKQQLKEIIEEIKAKYDPTEYDVYGFDGRKYNIASLNENSYTPINLTRNDELNRHKITSIVSAFDLLDDLGALTNDESRKQEIRDILELRASGNFGYYGRRDFIDGYIKDPFVTLELSSRRFASSAASQKYTPALESMKKALSKYTNNSATVRAIVERLNYVTDPSESFAWMKSFNYHFAMGGSVKSALIQLLNLFTNGQGYMDSLGGNVIYNKKITTEALTESRKLFSVKEGEWTPSFNIDNPAEVKRFVSGISPKFLTPAQKDMLATLIPTRYFESIVEQVRLEGKEALDKRFKESSLFRKTMTTVGEALKPLNRMTAIMESTGRISNQLAYTRLFTEDRGALTRFNDIFGNEPKFVLYKEAFTKKGFDEPTIAALYMTDEIFFITGTTGKSRLTTLPLANIVAPFSNFAIQSISGLRAMWRRDPKAFANTIFYYMLLGGLAGIPFFNNLNELTKLLFKLLGLGGVDLELEIRERIFDITGSAKLAEAATSGMPTLGGVDLSGSISQQLPFFNEIVKAFDPDTKASDVAALTGSYALSLGKGLGEVVNTVRDPYKDFDTSSFLEAVIPYKGARDLVKAYNSATQPITSRRGQPLLPAQSDDPLFVMLTAAGFQPAEISRARDKYYFEQLEAENPALNQLRTQRNNLWKNFMSVTDPQEKSKIREQIRTNAKEAQKEAFNQGVNFSLSRYLADGRSKGVELVTGVRDRKRLPKRLRKNEAKYKELFMVE